MTLDIIIKVLTIIGALIGMAVFGLTTAHLLVTLGVLKKTLLDLVVRMDRTEAKVDVIQERQYRAEGREEGRAEVASHIAPVTMHRTRG